MSDQYEFPLLARRGPVRPKRPERIFFGIFFDADCSLLVDRYGNEWRSQLGVDEPLLDWRRFHVSLHHLGDHKRLRSPLLYAAGLAGECVSMSEFEIVFGRLGSFNTPPKKGRRREWPLVLRAEPGPVQELHQSLGLAMARYGLRFDAGFVPHLTLAYTAKFVPFREIEPIRLMVTQFALVHSLLWLSQYDFHGHWMLRPNGC